MAMNLDQPADKITPSSGTLTVTGALTATGVNTVQAGTVSAPAITTTGDTNTGIFFPAADTIAFTEGGTEAMRLDSSGNMGIGTTSPTNLLSLNCPISSTKGLSIDFSGSAVAAFTANANTGEVRIGGVLSSWFPTFYSNGSESMRITSGGALCVGTTSATGSVRFIVESDSTTVNPMTVSNTRSTAATDYAIIFYRAGNIVGSVQTSLSATSFVTSSDYRLKENIAPMTGALSKVAQLNPVTYDWKAGGSSQGFIAHELQAVVPDCVVGDKDAVETYTDEDGNEQTRIKPQGIDTSFLVATLTAAIQELKATVDAQTARIAALENPSVEN
jgi:hypothetical protein